MPKTYDDIKDEHIGHTEEIPEPTCLICKKKGWLDEENSSQKTDAEKKEEREDEEKSSHPEFSDEASGYEKQGHKEEMEANRGW